MVPVTAGLIEDSRLVGGRCPSCGRTHFPFSGSCPYCGADGAGRVALATEGTLWAWTVVMTPPPGYTGEVPYGFGVVELPEGVRIVTRLTEADPDALAFGQAVRLAIVPLHDDVVTYAFEPAP